MIQLIPFNNKWKDFFNREKKMLLNVLKGQQVIEVEHIGATSVLLCETAGTIDLLCTIQNKYDLTTIKNLLVINGYQYIPSFSDLECFFFIRRNKKKQIVATIRVVEQASLIHKQMILFKYYLREKRSHVKSYNSFREALLKNCEGDPKKYREVKGNYIASILNDFCKVE